MHHQTTKTDDGYKCVICGLRWKSRPATTCPGVPKYVSGAAPARLKTKGQLKALWLKPGPIRAVVGWYEYPLFVVTEAIPYSADEIAAEKERQRAARYRHCQHCDRDVPKRGFDSEWKACDKCLGEVIRRHQEHLRAEYEKMLRVDRDNAILWARGVLSDSSAVIFLDTETTGLDLSAKIIQISLITIDGVSLFDSLVKPTQPIPPEVTAIHHITDLDVAQAPSFDMIYDRLKALLEGKRVVMYNAGFDIQMLRQSGRHYHLPALTIKKSCAMEMYAQFVGDWSDYFHDYRWHPLPGGDHTARGDCLATLELIKMMASTPLSSETVTLEK